MAKDPAFLFYPGDYISGTMHLDFECKGAYMDLLMLQFNKDRMTIHMIKQVLGHTFEHTWPLIFDKFVEKDGFYWNERLRIEKEKRIKFCKSRENNRNSPKHMSNHMLEHMENVNSIITILVSTHDLNGESEKEKTAIAMIIPEMMNAWLQYKPDYTSDIYVDYPALLKIAYYIAEKKGWKKSHIIDKKEYEVLASWLKIISFLKEPKTDAYFKRLTIDGIANPKNIQKIVEAMKVGEFAIKQKQKELETKRINPEDYFEK